MILDLWNSIRQLVWPRDVLEMDKPWMLIVDDFRTSSKEFYDRLEGEVRRREMPGVLVERLELAEAGLFSDQREFLCVLRERFRFELCAASFGTTFFFTLRTLFKPPKINRTVLLFLLAVFAWVLLVAARFYGWPLGLLVVFSGMFALIKTLRNVGRLGWDSVDHWLLNSWFVGGLYEAYFRPDTYYRKDVRGIFLSLTESIIKDNVQTATLSKGIRIPLSVLQPPRNVLLGGEGRDREEDGPPPT